MLVLLLLDLLEYYSFSIFLVSSREKENQLKRKSEKQMLKILRQVNFKQIHHIRFHLLLGMKLLFIIIVWLVQIQFLGCVWFDPVDISRFHLLRFFLLVPFLLSRFLFFFIIFGIFLSFFFVLQKKKTIKNKMKLVQNRTLLKKIVFTHKAFKKLPWIHTDWINFKWKNINCIKQNLFLWNKEKIQKIVFSGTVERK